MTASLTTPVPATVLRRLAPTGVVRATINLGNPVLAQRDAASGELAGVSVDLSRELARRLRVEAALVPFESAGKALQALTSETCDVGFLAIDPVRAAELSFTSPYVEIEGTYAVKSDAPFRSVEDVDQPGVRIAAGKNAAYDLYLSRNLQSAKLAYAATSGAAMELFLDEGLDAVAGIRHPLEAFARRHSGLRVIEGAFMSIRQAMAIARSDDPEAHDYLCAFVEDVKGSGFVADALARSGQASQ